MRLSIIIPAYNEEKRLPKTLLEINNYLTKQNYDSEIIVVSDGSKDQTAQVCRNQTFAIKSLKIIDNAENRGKGFVVRQGLLRAVGEFRLFTDADNSTSINQIEKMWPEFEKGFDVVVGSRDIKGAVLDPPQPWLRQVILGEGFKFFRKIVIGLWDVEDTQCGFKCFTKKAAEDILPKCKIDRFAFDPEILIVAKELGFRVKEIPVFWKNDPNSTVKFQSMIKMAIDLFKIKINIIKGIYAA